MGDSCEWCGDPAPVLGQTRTSTPSGLQTSAGAGKPGGALRDGGLAVVSRTQGHTHRQWKQDSERDHLGPSGPVSRGTERRRGPACGREKTLKNRSKNRQRTRSDFAPKRTSGGQQGRGRCSREMQQNPRELSPCTFRAAGTEPTDDKRWDDVERLGPWALLMGI